MNSKGELLSNPIECELYIVPRASDAREAVVMLHGMCPKCGETFIAREDNKTMSIDRITYRQAPKLIREQWERHCRLKGVRPSDSDKIPIVSSPERWACDYCKSWCVKVHAGMAVDDHRGVSTLHVPSNIPILDVPKEKKGLVEF